MERPGTSRRSEGFQDVNGLLERRSKQSSVCVEGAGGAVAATAVIRSTETCRGRLQESVAAFFWNVVFENCRLYQLAAYHFEPFKNKLTVCNCYCQVLLL